MPDSDNKLNKAILLKQRKQIMIKGVILSVTACISLATPRAELGRPDNKCCHLYSEEYHHNFQQSLCWEDTQDIIFADVSQEEIYPESPVKSYWCGRDAQIVFTNDYTDIIVSG